MSECGRVTSRMRTHRPTRGFCSIRGEGVQFINYLLLGNDIKASLVRQYLNISGLLFTKVVLYSGLDGNNAERISCNKCYFYELAFSTELKS